MNKLLKVNKLGLAAYMKAVGCKLVDYIKEDRVFTLESIDNKKEKDWEIEYINSLCYKHDIEVINLKKFFRK